MKSDADMLIQAVTADPLNPAAVAALTDMMQEQGESPERADAIARGVTVRARIDAFVKHADARVADYFKERNYDLLTPPTHRADFISEKWCRIVTVEHYVNGTTRVGGVYAFVALIDGYTKTLGAVRAGGIYMAASFKKPAKHARGSVFSADFDNCAGPYGINYLR